MLTQPGAVMWQEMTAVLSAAMRASILILSVCLFIALAVLLLLTAFAVVTAASRVRRERRLARTHTGTQTLPVTLPRAESRVAPVANAITSSRAAVSAARFVHGDATLERRFGGFLQ